VVEEGGNLTRREVVVQLDNDLDIRTRLKRLGAKIKSTYNLELSHYEWPIDATGWRVLLVYRSSIVDFLWLGFLWNFLLCVYRKTK
jgi:hypothetical protein